MRAHVRFLATLALALALLAPAGARAQGVGRVDPELLAEVMPAAERFGPVEGTPPVRRAYARGADGRERHVGFVFLTSDLPPEEMGYSGTIEALVGLDLEGTLTGMRVVSYRESLQNSRGDFLRRRGFQEQFEGKSLSDSYRVRYDLDGISGATITVAATARGVRNAARRVALAYLAGDRPTGPLTAEEMADLTWLDVTDRGLAQKIHVVDEGVSRIELSLFRIKDEAMGRLLLGDASWQKVTTDAGERAATSHFWLVGLDGGLEALFRPQVLFLVRGEDTLSFGTPDLIPLRAPRAGMVNGQFRNHGVLIVPGSVDVDRPFTWVLAFGTRLGGPYEAPYTPDGAPPTLAAAPAPAPPEPAEPDDAPADAAVVADAAPDGEAAPADAADDSLAALAEPGPVEPPPALDASLLAFEDEEEETVLGRTLAQTDWVRVALLVALLGLALVAFFGKRPAVRWVVLVATIAVLGFGGVGFLSVSHITSAIKVGPSVFLADLPLLLFVAFTIVTTLLWGRVFCGYLCPFGALQDVLERVVPKRFQRELPPALHDKALHLKYGVLALVLLPAAAGSSVSLFQYVEPFGTVFFLSSSVLLWTIAAGLLVAAAVVPRFYCRYACPLGASLALASTVSPFRIARVEQCTLCKVCEQDCPTGAIRGPDIDFKECVRCNRCELNLIRKVGVCRHDMGDVRSRLVPLQMARKGVAGGR